MRVYRIFAYFHHLHTVHLDDDKKVGRNPTPIETDVMIIFSDTMGEDIGLFETNH
jgi:hypothetical protein